MNSEVSNIAGMFAILMRCLSSIDVSVARTQWWWFSFVTTSACYHSILSNSFCSHTLQKAYNLALEDPPRAELLLISSWIRIFGGHLHRLLTPSTLISIAKFDRIS